MPPLKGPSTPAAGGGARPPRRPPRKPPAKRAAAAVPPPPPTHVVVEGDDLELSPYLHDARGAVATAEAAYPYLFEDADFPPGARAIEGEPQKRDAKCRCGKETVLSYVKRGDNKGKGYFHCATRKCSFFRWAYAAQRMQWHRFGRHNHHVLVSNEGFKADDLVQGKVGDCWFLSALAVIAERPDLIMRLFPKFQIHDSGVVEVRLFLDGFWRSIVVDNFFACMIDTGRTNEEDKRLKPAAKPAVARAVGPKPAPKTQKMKESDPPRCLDNNSNNNAPDSRRNNSNSPTADSAPGAMGPVNSEALAPAGASGGVGGTPSPPPAQGRRVGGSVNLGGDGGGSSVATPTPTRAAPPTSSSTAGTPEQALVARSARHPHAPLDTKQLLREAATARERRQAAEESAWAARTAETRTALAEAAAARAARGYNHRITETDCPSAPAPAPANPDPPLKREDTGVLGKIRRQAAARRADGSDGMQHIQTTQQMRDLVLDRGGDRTSPPPRAPPAPMPQAVTKQDAVDSDAVVFHSSSGSRSRSASDGSGGGKGDGSMGHALPGGANTNNTTGDGQPAAAVLPLGAQVFPRAAPPTSGGSDGFGVPERGDSHTTNPFAMSRANIAAIQEHNAMMAVHGARAGLTPPATNQSFDAQTLPTVLNRPVTTADLAYSKAHNFQMWVPFLEKAYAKAHGCYQAISGGEVAEAFLDLTGAPTLSVKLHDFGGGGGGGGDSDDDQLHTGAPSLGSTAWFRNAGQFNAKGFWFQLKSYHSQRLPMGCGTSGGRQLHEVGLVGHHAYSILQVKEFKLPDSFRARRGGAANTAIGNMSGFGNDGVARLLRIRNPHGSGEWKGDWSDSSKLWQETFSGENLGTGEEDGCFWMDYDNFLMAFSVVDICLAFPGLHARSFQTSFPAKLANIRTTKVYEVTPPSEANRCGRRGVGGDAASPDDAVEVFVMAIQKTKRGASSGRADRKKSYKPCDVGFLLLARDEDGDGGTNAHASSAARHPDIPSSTSEEGRAIRYHHARVGGTLLGFTKNGHVRFILSSRARRTGGSGGRAGQAKMLVVPVSFGHPAATDKELSFTVRVVASGPIQVTEVPAERAREAVRLDLAMQAFCLRTLCAHVLLDAAPRYRVLLCEKMGATAFVQLVVADAWTDRTAAIPPFGVTARVRGMACRTARGMAPFETIAKGQKFEASWRRYDLSFFDETASRLLAVFVRAGQDWQLGSVSGRHMQAGRILGGSAANPHKTSATANMAATTTRVSPPRPSLVLSTAPVQKPITAYVAPIAGSDGNGAADARAAASDDADYADRGIFAALKRNIVPDAVWLSGKDAKESAAASRAGTPSGHAGDTAAADLQEQLDLERALALSRGVGITGPDGASPTPADVAMSLDDVEQVMLSRAIAASVADGRPNVMHQPATAATTQARPWIPTGGASGSDSLQGDDDDALLQMALRASLRDLNPGGVGRPGAGSGAGDGGSSGFPEGAGTMGGPGAPTTQAAGSAAVVPAPPRIERQPVMVDSDDGDDAYDGELAAAIKMSLEVGAKRPRAVLDVDGGPFAPAAILPPPAQRRRVEGGGPLQEGTPAANPLRSSDQAPPIAKVVASTPTSTADVVELFASDDDDDDQVLGAGGGGGEDDPTPGVDEPPAKRVCAEIRGERARQPPPPDVEVIDLVDTDDSGSSGSSWLR